MFSAESFVIFAIYTYKLSTVQDPYQLGILV